MGKSKRSALRFALYIKALGAEPAPFSQKDFRRYAISLQKQYEELRRALDGKFVVEARNSVRALIRQQTLAVAAQAILPTSESAFRDEKALDVACPIARQLNVTPYSVLQVDTHLDSPRKLGLCYFSCQGTPGDPGGTLCLKTSNVRP